jgi:AsmA protein
MNKPLKYGLLGILGLLFLVIVAALAFAMTFDANRYKPEIERLVKEKTGRTLKLQGPLEAAIWPSLGAKVAGVTFSEHGSEQQFVALDSAHASVALLPLLHGQVVVDRIRISGLKARIVKEKDGRFNFSDLLEAKAAGGKPAGMGEPAEKGGAGGPVAFNVAGIDIDKSSIAYRDLASGQEYSVSDVKVSTGRLSENAEGKLQVRMLAKGSNPPLEVRIELATDYKLDLPGQQAALDKLSLKLASKGEETNIKGRLGVTKFSPPSYAFDLDIDRLNVDAYFPPEKPAASASAGEKSPRSAKPAADTPVDLSALRDLHANGKLQIGALQVRGLKLANVKTEVKAAGGKLEAPHSANLYEGTLSGTLGLQAEGRVALKDTLTGIAIGPLLRDAAQQDKLEGKGNLSLDVNAAGKSVNALKRALAGTAKLDLRDGAIKGIDIAALARKVQSLSGGGAQAAASAEKSPFTEMSASFLIKNGVAHNDDLDVKSPLFRLTGHGDIDIGSSAINYVTTASLSGHAVPVRLSGPFDAMKYEVDYGAAATDLAKSKAGERAKERLEDRVKGLLRR